jgi:hypothetical protein
MKLTLEDVKNSAPLTVYLKELVWGMGSAPLDRHVKITFRGEETHLMVGSFGGTTLYYDENNLLAVLQTPSIRKYPWMKEKEKQLDMFDLLFKTMFDNDDVKKFDIGGESDLTMLIAYKECPIMPQDAIMIPYLYVLYRENKSQNYHLAFYYSDRYCGEGEFNDEMVTKLEGVPKLLGASLA